MKKKLLLFYLNHYEWWGFFITPYIIWPRPLKKKLPTSVQYLQTKRYVIPLPSDNMIAKKKKKKLIWPEIHYLFFWLYDTFDITTKEFGNLIFSSLLWNYNPGKFPLFPRYSSSWKFDIYWHLTNVTWLFTEPSFFKNYLNFYFFLGKANFFSWIFFQYMFEKYWSSNLPLVRRWGAKYMTKKIAWYLLLARELIFKQLVFENLGLYYVFTENELKKLSYAGIDPNDEWYFWPTRRLQFLDIYGWDNILLLNWNKLFSTKKSSIGYHSLVTRAVSNKLLNMSLFNQLKKKEILPVSGSFIQVLFQILRWKTCFSRLIPSKIFYSIFNNQNIITNGKIFQQFEVNYFNFYTTVATKKLFFNKNNFTMIASILNNFKYSKCYGIPLLILIKIFKKFLIKNNFNFFLTNFFLISCKTPFFNKLILSKNSKWLFISNQRIIRYLTSSIGKFILYAPQVVDVKNVEFFFPAITPIFFRKKFFPYKGLQTISFFQPMLKTLLIYFFNLFRFNLFPLFQWIMYFSKIFRLQIKQKVFFYSVSRKWKILIPLASNSFLQKKIYNLDIRKVLVETFNNTYVQYIWLWEKKYSNLRNPAVTHTFQEYLIIAQIKHYTHELLSSNFINSMTKFLLWITNMISLQSSSKLYEFIPIPKAHFHTTHYRMLHYTSVSSWIWIFLLKYAFCGARLGLIKHNLLQKDWTIWRFCKPLLTLNKYKISGGEMRSIQISTNGKKLLQKFSRLINNHYLKKKKLFFISNVMHQLLLINYNVWNLFSAQTIILLNALTSTFIPTFYPLSNYELLVHPQNFFLFLRAFFYIKYSNILFFPRHTLTLKLK